MAQPPDRRASLGKWTWRTIVVAVVLAMAAVACTNPGLPTVATSAPAPTPDRPVFSEGEAIAVVQQAAHSGCLRQLDPGIAPGLWIATYIGNGQWEVTLESGFRDAIVTWKLFERSGAVGKASTDPPVWANVC